MNRYADWLRVALIDLRGSTKRFVILIACLALGIAAIGVISSVSSAINGAIVRDARVILGGDLELRASNKDIGAAEKEALAALGPVSREVELNARATKGDLSAFLSLRAVSGRFPLVGSVTLEPNGAVGDMSQLLESRNGVFGALLAPQAAQRLAVSRGDIVRIGSLDFELRGIIDTVPDQAAQGFQLGIPAFISDAALDASGLSQEGALNRFHYKVDLGDTSFAAAKATLDEQFPDHEWRLRAPRDASANIARFLDIFGNFLLLVALSSLVVGGLGISNAVTAYVGERQMSIATMRALGASNHRLLFHFVAQILVLSMVGLVIGLLIVAGASLILLPWLSGALGLALPAGIDIGSMLGAAAIGLTTALLFAWLPLGSVQSIRPALLFRSASAGNSSHMAWRDVLRWRTGLPLLAGLVLLLGLTVAITGDLVLVLIYFVATALALGLLRLAATLLTALLRRMPVSSNRAWRFAIAAIQRPGAPTATVLVSLGMGLSLLLFIILTQGNLTNQIAAEVTNDAPAFVLLDVDKATQSELEAMWADNGDITALDLVPMLRGTIVQLNGKPAPDPSGLPRDVADMFRGDTALTWAADMPADTVISSGDWWPTDYSGDTLVSLSTEMQNDLGLTLGDTMEMNILGRPITLTIASFRAIDWRAPTFNFRIILSPGIIDKAPQSYMGTIKVAEDAGPTVEQQLVEAFPLLTFIPVGDAIARAQSILQSLIQAVALVSGLALVAGVLVLAGALSVGRSQREADAVVMKVLGATRRDVISAFLLEYLLLGALATVLATIIAGLGAWAVSQFLLEIDFAINIALIFAVAVGVIALTVGTGALTTWAAMSARPASRLRAESQ
ncbi:FtsX-like permease family protein [Devosia rhodophyticola]|uniref:FtsX-like permease family protein n=1 Tax=Devosia rhodophyticola TaxID=3026423 RepID=A0ABY7YY69_9HYPH|nr:FtsX-like permease family protein [Devosia rhodophyticola]WDR06306.1 FtsX-like permease family protein [Devosia rhodophyticola]